MGNAGRNGGEYYTPRPLIRAMVQVVNPQIGETVYDPAIPIPEAVEEQSRIVLSIEKLQEESQRLTQLYERKLAAPEELKKSLLQQAFNGEL